MAAATTVLTVASAAVLLSSAPGPGAATGQAVGPAAVAPDVGSGVEVELSAVPPPPSTPALDTPVEDSPPTLAASAPERLVIESIDVAVDVMDLGLASDGTLEVPPGAFPAGWYTGSPTPGELGPAVLAGHVSYLGTPGVFADLAQVTRGDEVVVERADGSAARFVVTRTVDYRKSAFPTDAVYGDIDHAGLRLVTCGGLDPDSGAYEENLVVYAALEGTPAP